MDKELISEIDKVINRAIEIGLIGRTKDTSTLTSKAIRYLRDNNFLNEFKRGQLRPTKKAYDAVELGIDKYLENEINKSKSANITYNYNEGILIQDSFLSNNKVLNKTQKPPTPKPIKKKPISERLIENWWVLLVTVIGGVIVLAIQYKWFR